MKRLSLILIIACVLAFTGQACKRNSKGNALNTDTSGTTTARDSLSKTNAATVANTPVDKGDSAFVVTAASDGMTEVALGKIAQQKAVSKRVKAFGDMMITDHTKAGDELAALAKSKNITIPTGPDPDSQKKIDDLNKKTGKDFDKAYVDGMVDGHEKAVKLFTDVSQRCKDADLKAFATKTLPTLKMHLDSIKAIKANLK
jgi:putative membrane protein